MNYDKRRRNPPKPNKYYDPSPKLAELLGDFLRLKLDYIALENRKHSGPIDEERKALDLEYIRIKRHKYDALNVHIFRAMANLTYLLENMKEDPFIREIFDEDIKALFLAKSKYKPLKKQKTIFERFLEASCMKIITEKGEPFPDFRLVLIDIMQRLTFRFMEEMGPRHFSDPSLWNNIMKPDLQRAVAWIREVSHEARMNELRDERRTKIASREVIRPKVTRPALF